ncbi:hypothetical protein ACGFOU_36070 [Streptomyces sp. NPDC048595]|uniref:hypothetical protein n=1 Tax=Streptomyces sp. NPDC048595 TaxID=3365576 RepID=UPI003712476D
MSGSVRQEKTFYTCYSQYWLIGTLAGEEDWPEPDDPDDGFGQLEASQDGRTATVETYYQHGDMDLVFEFHDAEPTAELAGWHEVVEASMRFSDEVSLLNMDEATDAVPIPGGKPELSWWRVRLNVRREKEAKGAHPVGYDGVEERHVIQMWPAPASPRRVLVAAPEEEQGADGEEVTEVVDFAGIDLDESPTALVLHIGDEAPTFAGRDAVEVSGNGRGARIPICGWGEKPLSGAAISYRKALLSEAHAWERVAELTLTGTAQNLRIVPENGDPDAPFGLELAEPGPDGWKILVHARGRNPERTKGEYHVTVWPAGC